MRANVVIILFVLLSLAVPCGRKTEAGAQLSRHLNPLPGHAKKGPISDASARPGKSHVFRHCVLRAGFPYVSAESGLRAAKADRTRWDLHRKLNVLRFELNSNCRDHLSK